MTEKRCTAGQRFGNLVAIAPVDQLHWEFACDCGRRTKPFLGNVVRGLTRSCGCIRNRKTLERSLKHGHTAGRAASPTFKSWSHAKARCSCPTGADFGNYGARGIQMCEEWRESFETFLGDMGECPPGHSIERLDNNRGYEPGNCVWADRTAQNNNRRCTITVTWRGEALPFAKACKAANVNYWSARYQVCKLGRTFEEAAQRIVKPFDGTMSSTQRHAATFAV